MYDTAIHLYICACLAVARELSGKLLADMSAAGCYVPPRWGNFYIVRNLRNYCRDCDAVIPQLSSVDTGE